MKILVFVFKMGMSVIHILLYGIIAAYLIEFFVTHPTVNRQFSGYPHWGTLLLAAIATMVTCAITFASDRDDAGSSFIVSVFTRVAVIGVSWPFLRLAMHQDSVLEAVPFALCSLALFSAGVLGIGGIITRSRSAGWVLYGTAASVFLLFSIYLMGERTVRFERDEGQVNCVYQTRRWCGLHDDDSQQLTNVVGYQDKYQSEKFSDVAGDGVAIMSSSDDELLILDSRMQWRGLSQQVKDQLTAFLASADPRLELAERTPAAPLPVIIMITLAIYYGGITLDPQIRAARQQSDVTFTTYVGRILGVIVVGCALWGISLVFRTSMQTREAFSQLQRTAQLAEIRDFVIRGKTINTDGWYVRIGKPAFSDADLLQIIPYLDRAPTLWLDLSGTSITDAGIASLAKVDFIQILELRGLPITKDCQTALENIWMYHLDLRNTRIRATDIEAAKLYGLRHLLLTDPDFSERSMPSLFAIRDLEFVSIETGDFDPSRLDFWKEELEGIDVEIVPTPIRQAMQAETDQFDVP